MPYLDLWSSARPRVGSSNSSSSSLQHENSSDRLSLCSMDSSLSRSSSLNTETHAGTPHDAAETIPDALDTSSHGSFDEQAVEAAGFAFSGTSVAKCDVIVSGPRSRASIHCNDDRMLFKRAA